MPIARWWSSLANHGRDHAAICSGYSRTSDNPTHNTTHKSSPGNEQGHPGDPSTRPLRRTHIPLPALVARRVLNIFEGRRHPTASTARGDALTRGVYVFSPPEIDHAIDRNIEAIAHLMAALEHDLDEVARDHLLLAKSHVTLSNRKLSTLIGACPICGDAGFGQSCRNCGARRGQS